MPGNLSAPAAAPLSTTEQSSAQTPIIPAAEQLSASTATVIASPAKQPSASAAAISGASASDAAAASAAPSSAQEQSTPPAPSPPSTSQASDTNLTPQEATKKWNIQLELEQSLLARIEALRAKIQQIIDKSKTNEPKEGDKKENSKPKEPVPIPEPGDPTHQVLPFLFGLAFILIKIMNQENLNRQSIYNMNNYFEYLTYMIQVYQKLCNSAVTKGYPLKKDLLINSLKSFYAYFYMEMSEKMQELFKGAAFPSSTGWISTLSPEEDKKFASIEFMNIIDDLFKGIHPAFVYMVEDYQLTDPATIAKMKDDMEQLEKNNSTKQGASAQTLRGGSAPMVATKSSPAIPSAKQDVTPEVAAPKEKEPIKFTKSPVPDECKINEPCKRPIDELKSAAEDQTEQLNQVLEKGLTTITGGIDLITAELGKLASVAKDIHVSIIAHSQPPAEGSPGDIAGILKELKEVKGALATKIPSWIASFDTVSKISDTNVESVEEKVTGEELRKMGTDMKDKLGAIKAHIEPKSVLDTLLENTELTINKKNIEPTAMPLPKFQTLLITMKKLLELLQQTAADAKTRTEIMATEDLLAKAIEALNQDLPAILKIPAPPPSAAETAAKSEGSATALPVRDADQFQSPSSSSQQQIPPSSVSQASLPLQRQMSFKPGSMLSQRGLPPIQGTPAFNAMMDAEKANLTHQNDKHAIWSEYKGFQQIFDDMTWSGQGGGFTRDVIEAMGREVIDKWEAIRDDIKSIVANLINSGITPADIPTLKDLAASIKKFIDIFLINKRKVGIKSIWRSDITSIIKEANIVSDKMKTIRKIPGLILTVGGSKTLRRSKQKTNTTKKRLRRA